MHPIAFYIGSLEIRWYGILFATGFLAGFWTACRRAWHDHMSGEAIADLIPWVLLSALAGARLLYVIEYHEEFVGASFWDVINIRRGGLVYHGGMVAAILTTVGYLRWKKRPLWRTADVLAPSIALGHAFGRIGCFLNGCCYGLPTTLPWGVHFPEGHPSCPAAVHPTQLYEAGVNFLLYAALAWHFRYRRRFAGETFALYLVAYGLLRFVLEFLRGDYGEHRLLGLTPGQPVSLVVLAAGLALWFGLARRRPPTGVSGSPPASSPAGKAGSRGRSHRS